MCHQDTWFIADASACGFSPAGHLVFSCIFLLISLVVLVKSAVVFPTVTKPAQSVAIWNIISTLPVIVLAVLGIVYAAKIDNDSLQTARRFWYVVLISSVHVAVQMRSNLLFNTILDTNQLKAGTWVRVLKLSVVSFCVVYPFVPLVLLVVLQGVLDGPKAEYYARVCWAFSAVTAMFTVLPSIFTIFKILDLLQEVITFPNTKSEAIEQAKRSDQVLRSLLRRHFAPFIGVAFYVAAAVIGMRWYFIDIILFFFLTGNGGTLVMIQAFKRSADQDSKGKSSRSRSRSHTDKKKDRSSDKTKERSLHTTSPDPKHRITIDLEARDSHTTSQISSNHAERRKNEG